MFPCRSLREREAANVPGTDSIVLTLEDLRAIAQWAADCADRVLPMFESVAVNAARAREAIEAARTFAGGGKRTARIRSVALAAFAAAREIEEPAVRAAARSAGLAASSAYTHPLASIDQAKHVLGPAVYAALARDLASGAAAADEEIKWAIRKASPNVREIMRRFPKHSAGRTRLATLYHQLDSGLRSDFGLKNP